jgi:outer membrane protein TolC
MNDRVSASWGDPGTPRRAPSGRLAAVLVLAALVAGVAGAQPVSDIGETRAPGEAKAEFPNLIPLTEAVRLALEHNHALRAATHADRAATWAHRKARAQLLPSISLESAYTRLDEQTVSRANAFGREITMYLPDSTGELQPVTIDIPQTVFRDGYETSIKGQLLLLNPSVWNGAALSGASKNRARDELEAAVQSTAHETLVAYLDLLRLHSLVRVQEEHAAQASRNAEQAERFFDVGRYSEADVLRWRVEEAQQQVLLQETRRSLRVATLRLENLIGSDPLAALLPDSTLTGGLLREIGRFRSMSETRWSEFLGVPLEDVIAQNPQVAILEHTEHLSKLEHRQSLIDFMPSVTVAGSYGWQNNDTPGLDGDRAWAVTAAVTVPIFDSLANVSGYQTTKHRLLQTREAVRDGRRGLMLAAESARTAVRSTAAQLSLAEASLTSARRGFEIQRNRFALGRLSTLEWIDANLALRSAQQSHTSSYYGFLLAIVDYYQATGEILTLLEP